MRIGLKRVAGKKPKGMNKSTFSITYALFLEPPNVSNKVRLIAVREPGSRSNKVIWTNANR
ncbi:hypothetical protein K170097C1_52530 [Hungatella effluvii]